MSARLDITGTGEVADRLGITKNLVAQWLRRGKLPPPDRQLEMGPVWRTTATIERRLDQRGIG